MKIPRLKLLYAVSEGYYLLTDDIPDLSAKVAFIGFNGRATDEVIAKDIITAVNAHDALVKAVEAVLAGRGHDLNAWNQLRAALTAAKGA